MAWQEWLYALAVAALMALVGVGTLISGQALRHWTPAHNLLLSWPDNLLRLAVVLLCLVLGATFGPGPAALGWQSQNLGAELLLGLQAGLLLALLLNLAGRLVVRRSGEGVYSIKMLRCILPLGRREWAGVLLWLLPAAALEELLFRSLPLGALGWPLAAWALWPLALIFGALHWPQGWWGIAGTALAAMALSVLFLTTGSIWPPLAAHYVMNVAQLILAAQLGVRPLRAARPT